MNEMLMFFETVSLSFNTISIPVSFFVGRNSSDHFSIVFEVVPWKRIWFITNTDVDRVFASGPWDRCLVPGRVIWKAQKMVFDGALLNNQQYWVGIKNKDEQSREKSWKLPYTSV